MSRTNTSITFFFISFVVVLIILKSTVVQDQLIKGFRGPNPSKPVEYKYSFR